jgi:hypothetical protein
MNTNISSFPLRISGKCISCKEDFFFNETSETFNEVNDVSTDCPHCKALLLIRSNRVWSFHNKLHEENPKWPKDGKGTDFLEYEQ